MSKLEYLKQLEEALNGKISAAELNDIIRDYAEYFEEGKKQGKAEDEISKNLGIPSEVAEQILNADKEVKAEKTSAFKQAAQKLKKVWKSAAEDSVKAGTSAAKGMLYIAAAILMLPIVFVAVLAVGSVTISAVGMGISSAIIGTLAWAAVSILGIILPTEAVAAGVLLGLALVCIGVTVVSGMLWALSSFVRWLKQLFSEKEPEGCNEEEGKGEEV
ncbi:MAG: DUF1700 domain-containing protein [Oscillospiraceae bacterium]|nr:DUF1700 domain-containing protein [Oscillospiraceae bacterium]